MVLNGPAVYAPVEHQSVHGLLNSIGNLIIVEK